jgi:hypothetical protein
VKTVLRRPLRELLTTQNILLGVGIGLAVFFLYVGLNFGPGSYPNAERYKLSNSEAEIIQAVNNFKYKNPEFVVPEITIQHYHAGVLPEGRRSKDDYWYHIYFYYREDDQIVKAWLRPSLEGGTTFALIGINQSLELGNWKDINSDFGFFENRRQKRKFEERILNKIKAELSLQK